MNRPSRLNLETFSSRRCSIETKCMPLFIIQAKNYLSPIGHRLWPTHLELPSWKRSLNEEGSEKAKILPGTKLADFG